MVRIETYVLLDLETSSLPCQDLNKTKITELSMVVVKRRHILETNAGDLPRVQHKLTMCFNPGRIINPEATNVSGLDNDLLEHESLFSLNVFNTINSFIECQEKPVCLVAQNGLKFDFPILKNHFEKLNVSLDKDVMCADSLDAFYDILNNKPIVYNDLVELSVDRKPINNVGIDNKEELDSNTITHKSDSTVESDKIERSINDDQSPLSFKVNNENTPKSNTVKLRPAKRLNDVRRKLFYDKDKKPANSYKLGDIYQCVLNRPGIVAHRAENDCIMLAQITTAKAKQFVEWIDANHCAFSEVKAMTLGVPLGH